MSDDDHGRMAFGPFDPKDLPGMIEALEQVNAQNEDSRRMTADANQVQLHHLLESLSDEQLADLADVVRQMAMEGKHNYFAQAVYGIILAHGWFRRKPENELLNVPEKPAPPEDEL